MSGSTISTTISGPIVVNSQHLKSLTITSTGAVLGPAGTDLIPGSVAVEMPLYGTGGTVVNYGTIAGGNAADNEGGTGIVIEDGRFTNFGHVAGGSAAGPGAGLVVGGGYVDNWGTVSGGTATHNFIDDNATGAEVTSYRSFNSQTHTFGPTEYGTLVNHGLIEAGSGNAFPGAGVSLNAGTFINFGTVTGYVQDHSYIGSPVLLNYGTLNGPVVSYSDITIINAGLINEPIAIFQGTIIADAGAIFAGAVDASSAFQNTLELSSSPRSDSGTLDMGGSFSGFSTIQFDSDARWSLEGTTSELASGETITGFKSGDTLVLDGGSVTSGSFVSGVGLVLAGAFNPETIDIVGSFSTADFNITPGYIAVIDIICYLRGTRVLTPAGEINVEDLSIGDAVVTRFSGVQPIKWIGRQSFGAQFIKTNRDRIPVRIRAGALGKNLPARDLFVSPGHSMLVGGVLILAKFLVNGVTITQDEVPEEVHYYQIEFATHDCLIAAGAWSESYADVEGLRGQFHNAAEFHKLYPSHRAPAVPALCSPRPESGAALEKALLPVVAGAAAAVRPGPPRGWIDVCDRSKIGGWVQDLDHQELPVLLEIVWPGRLSATTLAFDYRDDLERAGFGRGRCSFTYAFPISLPAAALNEIKVRRACDGAEILPTEDCLAKIQKVVTDRVRPTEWRHANRPRFAVAAA